MALYFSSPSPSQSPLFQRKGLFLGQFQKVPASKSSIKLPKFPSVSGCSAEPSEKSIGPFRTCKQCKKQYDPSLNHPRACRYHTGHFGGETKRKFESVYAGGTMNTPDSGKIFLYWHCCGSEDPFDPGCTASLHSSYDD